MESIEDASQIEASAASLNLPEVSILFENVLGDWFLIIIHWSKLWCSHYDLLLFFSCPQEGASFYDIDNEEYEAMSVEVRLLPRKLRFFCSAERREQLAQAQWWWLCWSVEKEPEGLLTKLETIPTTPKRGVKWILSSHKSHHTPTKQSVVYRLYESAVKLTFWWLLTAWMRLLTYYSLFCFSKTNTIMKMIMQRWLKNLLKKLKAIHETVSVWPDEDQE